MILNSFLLAVVLSIFSSCATEVKPLPSAADLNSSWNSYDEYYNRISMEGMMADINPSEGVYLNRSAKKISADTFRQVSDLAEFLSLNYGSLERWADMENYRSQNYTNISHHTDDALKEILADLDDKESRVKELDVRVKAVSKAGQVLIPRHYATARKFLASINLSNVAKDKKTVLAAFRIKSDRENANGSSRGKYSAELNKFKTVGYKEFNLTQNESDLPIVRSDLVADSTLDLGTIIFKLKNSKTLKIVGHKMNNQNPKTLTILTEGRSKVVKAEFNFVIKENYAVLQSAETGTEKATGPQAMIVLNLAAQ